MATVKWTMNDKNPNADVALIKAYTDYAPKKVMTVLTEDETRAYTETTTGVDYKKCYAFLEYMRNAYQISAPFDMTIHIDENGRVQGIEAPRQTSARVVLFRSDPSASTNVVLSLVLHYVFYSSDNVLIEQIPAFMSYDLAKQGVTVVPGTFNIGKWVRPIEFALEIAKGTREVTIKQGTPLCYLRFVPEDGSSVVLKETPESDELLKVMATCTGLKYMQSQTPLKECYKKAKRFVDAFLRPSKCPFRRNKGV